MVTLGITSYITIHTLVLMNLPNQHTECDSCLTHNVLPIVIELFCAFFGSLRIGCVLQAAAEVGGFISIYSNDVFKC